MDNLPKVFSETKRVLKPGGKFIFSIDCFENDSISESFKIRYFKERGIIEKRGGDYITNLLKDNGFLILKRKYLFKSSLGNALQIMGLKLSENRIRRIFLVPIITLSFFPLIKLLDMLNKNKKGNVCIVEAKKNGI
jgi:SAM-dependent methyltransferase